MSTTYILLPVGGNEQSVPSIDITEQSSKYEITCWPKLSEYLEYVEFTDLTAEQVITVAIKLLQVVLYQHPELFPEIVRQVNELRPGAKQ